MKKITVRISKGGATIKSEGYMGETCRSATAALEKALGRVISDEPTDEMFQQDDEWVQEGE